MVITIVTSMIIEIAMLTVMVIFIVHLDMSANQCVKPIQMSPVCEISSLVHGHYFSTN